MRKSKKGDFLFYVAGGLLVLAFVLGWFVSSPSALGMLYYVGWIIWAVGIVLIFLPIFVFHRKGRVEKGESFVHTTVLVETGIYAIVRHPLYLGWLLMYSAIIFWSQHWLTAIVGIAGMACVYLY
jgi:protein-S-isoprenylcysteine O-methyltransferase Ste14